MSRAEREALDALIAYEARRFDLMNPYHCRPLTEEERLFVVDYDTGCTEEEENDESL